MADAEMQTGQIDKQPCEHSELDGAARNALAQRQVFIGGRPRFFAHVEGVDGIIDCRARERARVTSVDLAGALAWRQRLSHLVREGLCRVAVGKGLGFFKSPRFFLGLGLDPPPPAF